MVVVWGVNVGKSHHSASKAGVIDLTKTLARELARYDVLVNAIAACFCNTPRVMRIPGDIRDQVLKPIPVEEGRRPEGWRKCCGISCFNGH